MTDSTATSSDSTSSVSLLLGLREGDDDSWRKLVDLYAPLVRVWCRYSGVPEERIPDVLQDVFLAIHRSVDRYEARETTTGFRGWVWMITKNKIRDHFRSTSREPLGTGGSAALDQIRELPDVDGEANLPIDAPSQPSDTASLLHRALEMVKVDFKPATWNAFWRATVLGQSTEQIAQEMGISNAAVRQAKSRVLRRLRQQLGDQK